jgi:hypothetical protein
MTIQRPENFRPLCPSHYIVMVFSTDKLSGGSVDTPGTTNLHHCECPVDKCPQNYSPGYGYFTLEKNEDFWHTTGSSSVKISMNPTQVICGGEHKNKMFIETFDARTNVRNFRCPEKDCNRTMKIPANGPPAWWLGEGFFKST